MSLWVRSFLLIPVMLMTGVSLLLLLLLVSSRGGCCSFFHYPQDAPLAPGWRAQKKASAQKDVSKIQICINSTPRPRTVIAHPGWGKIKVVASRGGSCRFVFCLSSARSRSPLSLSVCFHFWLPSTAAAAATHFVDIETTIPNPSDGVLCKR